MLGTKILVKYSQIVRSRILKTNLLFLLNQYKY